MCCFFFKKHELRFSSIQHSYKVMPWEFCLTWFQPPRNQTVHPKLSQQTQSEVDWTHLERHNHERASQNASPSIKCATLKSDLRLNWSWTDWGKLRPKSETAEAEREAQEFSLVFRDWFFFFFAKADVTLYSQMICNQDRVEKFGQKQIKKASTKWFQSRALSLIYQLKPHFKDIPNAKR